MGFVEKFGLLGPLVVAPLGGGPTTPELVAVTSEAGALGTLAGAYLSAEQIEQAAASVRQKTSRAFGVNLFTPMPELKLSDDQIERALKETAAIRAELGIPDPALKAPFHHDFDMQFEAVLRVKPRVFSFVFGLLDRSYLSECKKNDIYVIGTATSLEEALQLQDSGVDAVIAQGAEAGAHRGIFSAEAPDPMIGTLDLTKELSQHLKVPVIAAGGLMNGADIVQALKAGAEAAMLGTAFLLCPEAGTSVPYRKALLDLKTHGTKTTRAFSGRLARGIENRFIKEVGNSILPFPAQNAFTRDIRNRATQLGKPEFLSLWAGTGHDKIREVGAADLVRTLFGEIRNAEEIKI